MQVPENAYLHSPQIKQRGAALIVIMFFIGLAVTALLIKSYNADSIKAQQEEKTMQALGQAKEALLAWAVSYRDLPGLMPYPNRGTDADGYEDGGSDCFATSTSFNYQFLLGMLPSQDSKDTNCITLSRKGISDFRDAAGNPLWYAVSRNLVVNYDGSVTNPVINPGIVNSPDYDWLRVFDTNGNLISNKVAAVIIAPGSPLAGQNRTNSATSAHFLDQITIGATTYSNRDYDQADEDFVMGSDSEPSNIFNDRLVFITIDELMAALERRAASEARDVLQRYQGTVGEYPYASPLGSTGKYNCVDATMNGLLPLDSNPSSTCTCSSNRNCSCDFGVIDSVSFSQTLFDWDNATDSCSALDKTCTCTGSGRCSWLFLEFECDAAGNCESNYMPGTFEFSGVFENANVYNRSGACTHSCGSDTVSCTGNGTFSSGGCSDPGIAPTITVNIAAGSNQLTTASSFITEQIVAGMHVFGSGIQSETVVTSVTNATTLVMSRNATNTALLDITFSRLPEWFLTNNWQDYIYYAVSKDASPTMTVGGRTGVEALLVAVGAPIGIAPFTEAKGAPQTRVSCSIDDYLDSDENVSANQAYEPTNKQRALNYNDQLFIVAP